MEEFSVKRNKENLEIEQRSIVAVAGILTLSQRMLAAHWVSCPSTGASTDKHPADINRDDVIVLLRDQFSAKSVSRSIQSMGLHRT